MLDRVLLRSFGQVDCPIEISIDKKVQKGAIHFIISKQNNYVSFPPVCGALHNERQGCSGGGCSMTAYVTLALVQAGLQPKV